MSLPHSKSRLLHIRYARPWPSMKKRRQSKRKVLLQWAVRGTGTTERKQ